MYIERRKEFFDSLGKKKESYERIHFLSTLAIQRDLIDAAYYTSHL